MGFEFSEIRLMQRQLVELSRRLDDIHMRVAKRVAQLAIRKVKKMTPVDSGDLRQNWKYSVVKKGNTYHIQIYNHLEYAGFVEWGHRVVIAGQTVGWVEGRFMLKLTMAEMKRLAPNMWKKDVEKEVRRVFGN